MKTKDKDHIPDATYDNHQKAVFHESKKTVRYPWYIDQPACLMPNATNKVNVYADKWILSQKQG